MNYATGCEADEGFIEAVIGGGEADGGDGTQQLLGEVPDFRGVEPWVYGIHQ